MFFDFTKGDNLCWRKTFKNVFWEKNHKIAKSHRQVWTNPCFELGVSYFRTMSVKWLKEALGLDEILSIHSCVGKGNFCELGELSP